MADSGPLVSVFGVGLVEADLQAEGLAFGLFLEEIDRPVPKDLGFVTHRSIGLFFKKRPAKDFLAHVPHESGGIGCYVDVLLTKMTGAVACRFENGKIGTLTEGRVQGPRGDPIEMLAFVGTGEETRPSHPTGGGGDKGVFKSYSLVCKPINMGSFNNRMPGASKGMVALIVGVEQEKIGAGSRVLRRSLFFSRRPFALWLALGLLHWIRRGYFADFPLLGHVPFLEQGAQFLD